MNQEKMKRGLRFAGCAALLALLVMSSCAARRPAQVPAVPVMAHAVSAQAMAGTSVEETRLRLTGQRERAMALLQSIVEDPRAQQQQISAALDKKMQIAGYMETEAAVGALLEQMGFGDTAVVMSEGVLSVIVPWQAAENEQSRVRIIDTASSHSGLPAEAVKIILSKK